MNGRSAMVRAQGQLRLAWLAVVFAGAMLAGAREQLHRIAREHDAECARLRGQLDDALDHFNEQRAATPPSGDEPA